MPVFYFDYDDGRGAVRDHVGTELGDVDAALVEATQTMAELAADAIPGSRRRALSLTVRDQLGRSVLELSLSYKAEITGGSPA
jgi:hypothetical protein